MEILKNKIVDVSTSKKVKKALKVLRMFNQRIMKSCGYYLENSAHPVTKYIALDDLCIWDYVPFISNRNQHDIIQPSELKKILAKELLKEDGVVIIEGPKPKRTRWIVSINKVEYYGDAGLKFSTHYATSLNNPSYRTGSEFCGKFIRFATNDEAAKLIEEVAINTHTETIDTPSTNTLEKAWLQSLRMIPRKKVFFGKNNDIPVYKKQVIENDTKSENLKHQQYDLSIWRKTCFIPFSSIYSHLPTITPLPPFLEVLKKDIQQKRENLGKETSEFKTSYFAGYQPEFDLCDALAYLFAIKNLKNSTK